MKDYIFVKGAKEHNLKNVDIKLPRNKLIVITGLSGSGKSSLAFDTIYAEGQRRYVESLSSYARQFLEQLQKPNVEYIEGLSPAISIEQRMAGSNPRSTVGTQTEIYDYLRLLFAKIGRPHCPKCKREITQQSAQEIADKIMRFPKDSKLTILAPLIRGKKGEHKDIFSNIEKEGFVRVRVDGKVIDIEDIPVLNKKVKHTIEVVVDRLVLDDQIKKRLLDSVETALKVSAGTIVVKISHVKKAEDHIYSEKHACVHCGISFEELSPRAFSFNSPYGACPKCGGLGNKMEIDTDLIIPDKSRSLITAVQPWRRGGRGIVLYYRRLLRSLARDYDFDVDTPYRQLDKGIKKIVLYGDED
ncbi:MAG: excinuclease ABC subunit UvrA, partial [Candidatus Omnitrophica bacterium]|nr:excinuclease ABC subunit UvrA [Candidatus Omnitrophota bacterium]